MTNKINGDFGSDALEAFRAAYAAQLASPEEHDIDPVTGIPTNVISNTSPWIEHTGLWKANDGMSRDFKPNQPFNLEDYVDLEDTEDSEDVDGTEEDLVEELEESNAPEDLGEPTQYLSDEEFEAFSKLVWGDNEDEDDELNEEEIDNLIDEILGEDDNADDEDGADEDGADEDGEEEDDAEEDDDEEDTDEEDDEENDEDSND